MFELGYGGLADPEFGRKIHLRHVQMATQVEQTDLSERVLSELCESFRRAAALDNLVMEVSIVLGCRH